MNGANGHPAVVIARMEPGDIPQVVEIDRLSFPLPWSEASYRYEVTENKAARFIVAAAPALTPKRGWFARLTGQTPARLIAGYAGFWFVVDEAHIGTIATHPDWRGHGIGERLLVSVLREALGLGALEAKLEVRVGNHAAQSLYRKYSFEEVGRRKGYYRDNHEDALLMTVRLEGETRARVLDQYDHLRTQETA